VLWVILAPVLLALAGRYFLSVHVPAFFTFSRYSLGLHPTQPVARDQVLNLAAMAAWVLLVVLFNALVDWRRLRHLPAVVRRYLVGVPMAAAFSVVIPLRGTWGIDVIRDALARLSRALPGNLAALIGISMIPMAALYWAVQRVCEEGEYTDRTWEGKDGWTIPTAFNRDAAIR
jgi:hypothetical protein